MLLEHAAIQVVQVVFAAPQESGTGPLPLAAILFAARKSVAIRERPDIATGRSTLTAAACGGLGSAPDCRTRRASLHLSYSSAPPLLMAVLVSHDPKRASTVVTDIFFGPKLRRA